MDKINLLAPRLSSSRDINHWGCHAAKVTNASRVSGGGVNEDITVVRVPGAYELPIACKKMAAFSQYNGIIALGAVIRGSTPHFDYVCSEAAKGIAQVSLQSGLPVGFGLLTCDTLEQAIERAGAHVGNKGAETAAAVVETIRVMEQL